VLNAAYSCPSSITKSDLLLAPENARQRLVMSTMQPLDTAFGEGDREGGRLLNVGPWSCGRTPDKLSLLMMTVVGLMDSEAVDECRLRDSSNMELRRLKPGLSTVNGSLW